MQSVDVAIVGGGMVGLAVACGLTPELLPIVPCWCAMRRKLCTRLPGKGLNSVCEMS